MATTGNPPAVFGEAFLRLKQSVSPIDAVNFQSTALKDVWKAVLDIEKQQRERGLVRNLSRIKPLLDGLEKYSKTIEVLCNGTPFLPWIWAPIKLLLQLASEHLSCFEELIKAYVQIADALPRFDRLQTTFKNEASFQIALGLVYGDILEFHTQAYRFFRRRGWYILFSSLWKNFHSRFSSILEDLSRHRELVDKEAISIDIAEARTARIKAQEELERREIRRQEHELQDATAWIGVDDTSVRDDVDRLLQRRQIGTCDWILTTDQISSWLSDSKKHPILWLKGKPGAGKSVLSSHILDHIQSKKNSHTAYYLCNSYSDGKDLCAKVLKTIALQLVRSSSELAALVTDKYASIGTTSSLSQIKKLLPELLDVLPSIRIVIDGLDECPLADQQKDILKELCNLQRLSKNRCKILISSRENSIIGKAMKATPILSLTIEEMNVNNDIKLYVHEALSELRETFGEEVIEGIEKTIVKKADGMFLWVRLIIADLEDCHSVETLEAVATSLPEGLSQAYAHILKRLCYSQNVQKSVLRILSWISCSYRLLRTYEILDAIVFHPENTNLVLDNNTKQHIGILDYCKPFIEQGPSSTVDFVHFSAKEYILSERSGPYINQAEAHFDIAFSCVAYLSSSLCLRIEMKTDAECLRLIAGGYHNLHSYAHGFWLDHVLEFAKCRKHISKEKLNALNSQLLLLATSLKPAIPPSTCYDEEMQVHTMNSIFEALSCWESKMYIQSFFHQVMAFKNNLAKEASLQNLEDFKSYELREDPTYLTEISNRYQVLLEILLNGSEVHDVDPVLVCRFREIYSYSHHPCRFFQCQEAPNGFATIEARNEHEATHTRVYRCRDLSCEFSNRSFGSKGGLNSHERKYHANAINNILPIRQRRQQCRELRYGIKAVDKVPLTNERTLQREKRQHQQSPLQNAMENKELKINCEIVEAKITSIPEEVSSDSKTLLSPLLNGEEYLARVQLESYPEHQTDELQAKVSARLQQIMQEEAANYKTFPWVGFPMHSEDRVMMISRLINTIPTIQLAKRTVSRWFGITHDEKRLRQFFQAEMKIMAQLIIEKCRQHKFNDMFSITPDEVENSFQVAMKIISDVHDPCLALSELSVLLLEQNKQKGLERDSVESRTMDIGTLVITSSNISQQDPPLVVNESHPRDSESTINRAREEKRRDAEEKQKQDNLLEKWHAMFPGLRVTKADTEKPFQAQRGQQDEYEGLRPAPTFNENSQKDPLAKPYIDSHDETPLQRYEGRLISLEEENRRRLLLTCREQEDILEASLQNGPPTGPYVGRHALSDYNDQLILLKEENRRRLLLTCREQEDILEASLQNGPPTGPHVGRRISSDYNDQLVLLENENKECLWWMRDEFELLDKEEISQVMSLPTYFQDSEDEIGLGNFPRDNVNRPNNHAHQAGSDDHTRSNSEYKSTLSFSQSGRYGYEESVPSDGAVKTVPGWKEDRGIMSLLHPHELERVSTTEEKLQKAQSPQFPQNLPAGSKWPATEKTGLPFKTPKRKRSDVGHFLNERLVKRLPNWEESAIDTGIDCLSDSEPKKLLLKGHPSGPNRSYAPEYGIEGLTPQSHEPRYLENIHSTISDGLYNKDDGQYEANTVIQ